MPKVTLSEIAQRCATSTSTVSRVLSGDRKRKTSREKRELIIRTAQEMGWFDSRLEHARILRPFSLAVLFLSDHESLLSPFFADILAGIQESAASCTSLDIEVRVLSHYDKDFFASFENGGFDAAILLGRCRKETLERVRSCGLRLVYAGLNPVGGMDEVICDARQGTGQAFDHLYGLGHRKIAFIGPCGHDEIENEFRYDGYLEALSRHGMEVDGKLVVDSYLSSGDGYRKAAQLFAASRPSAVICANDNVAVGVLKWLTDNGIGVPDEVSLVGFDNIEASAFLNVPLTTMDVPRKELGRLALLLVRERMESGRDYPVQLTLPFRLIERQSTKEVGR